MDVLHIQNARGFSTVFRSMCGTSVTGMRPARHSIRSQRCHRSSPYMAIHGSRRCQKRNLDRHPQKFLSYHIGDTMYLRHSRQHRHRHHLPAVRHRFARNRPRMVLRRPQIRLIFLETVHRRHIHGHSHNRARPRHDATQSRMPRLRVVTEKHDSQRSSAIFRNWAVPPVGNSADYILQTHIHTHARQIR